MSLERDRVLQCLQRVAELRAQQAGNPCLAQRVRCVKRYQHRRLEKSHADLLEHPRYTRAARFFLDELYGPRDFTDRDTQFARVVPGMSRFFPADVVATVAALAELHLLSEELDAAMAARLRAPELDALRYVQAWQETGHRDERHRQVLLMRQVGDALEHYTHSPLLGATLRLMRGPARAAGLSALQSFLERGFDTFAQMHGAGEFLDIISRRERALVDRLFGCRIGAADSAVLVELP